MITLGRAAPVVLSAMAAALSGVIALEAVTWRQPLPTGPVRPAKSAEPNLIHTATGPDPHNDWFNHWRRYHRYDLNRHLSVCVAVPVCAITLAARITIAIPVCAVA